MSLEYAIEEVKCGIECAPPRAMVSVRCECLLEIVLAGKDSSKTMEVLERGLTAAPATAMVSVNRCDAIRAVQLIEPDYDPPEPEPEETEQDEGVYGPDNGPNLGD